MADTIRTQEAVLKRRNTIKMPQLFIEEGVPTKDAILNVHYGKNHSCVIIIPKGIKLNADQQTRISRLVNEQLA